MFSVPLWCKTIEIDNTTTYQRHTYRNTNLPVIDFHEMFICHIPVTWYDRLIILLPHPYIDYYVEGIYLQGQHGGMSAHIYIKNNNGNYIEKIYLHSEEEKQQHKKQLLFLVTLAKGEIYNV